RRRVRGPRAGRSAYSPRAMHRRRGSVRTAPRQAGGLSSGTWDTRDQVTPSLRQAAYCATAETATRAGTRARCAPVTIARLRALRTGVMKFATLAGLVLRGRCPARLALRSTSPIALDEQPPAP